MRINQNGGQKSLLNQFLQNLRQSALERNIGPSQAAITVDVQYYHKSSTDEFYLT